MGIDVPFSLGMDALAEDTIRSDDDRKRGRLADIDGTPVLDLLRSARGIPLHSFRIRDRFLDWLATCDPRDARSALALLKRDAGPFSNREHLGIAVLERVERVDYLRAAGYLESEAVQRVAEQGAPWPAEMVGVESTVEALGSRALPPMSIGLVRSLLRDGKRAYLIPRKLARHKRPSASKRATTSSAVYSDPKPAETSPLSTLPRVNQPTQKGNGMTNYLTTTEAAGRLKMKPQTLRAWRLSGKGPRFSKPSASRVLYAEEELTRFLEDRTFAHTAEETTRRASGRAA